jgi:hypothetical protein
MTNVFPASLIIALAFIRQFVIVIECAVYVKANSTLTDVRGCNSIALSSSSE